MRRVRGSRTGSFHTRVKRESEEESNRTKLALQMKELYWTRGAQMGLHTMIRQMCLKEEFWLCGITSYYKGSDGEERVEYFSG